MRNQFAKLLLEKAKEDSSILLITGDLGYGVLDEFARELPNQYINSGINEQSMMSMAAGLASQGFRPFVYSIANFPTFRALEQIRNDICYMNNPVTVVAVGAGLGYGSHGFTHHAVEDFAVLRSLPNMRIFSPGDSAEVGFSLNQILGKSQPAYLRLGKGGEPSLEKYAHIGEIYPTALSDSHGVILFTGSIGQYAIEAKNILSTKGIRIEALSFPEFDEIRLNSILKEFDNLPLITLEEHVVAGGFGSWVLEQASQITSMKMDIRVLGLNNKDDQIVGSQEYLIENLGISAETIANSLQSQIKGKTV